MDAVAYDLLSACREADKQIEQIRQAFGAPGDWGYEKKEGKALFALYAARQELRRAINQAQATISAEAAQ